MRLLSDRGRGLVRERPGCPCTSLSSVVRGSLQCSIVLCGLERASCIYSSPYVHTHLLQCVLPAPNPMSPRLFPYVCQSPSLT